MFQAKYLYCGSDELFILLAGRTVCAWIIKYYCRSFVTIADNIYMYSGGHCSCTLMETDSCHKP